MAISKAQQKAVYKYEKANYYKVLLRLPLPLKEKLMEKSGGSINGYIVDLIKKDLGIEEK